MRDKVDVDDGSDHSSCASLDLYLSISCLFRLNWPLASFALPFSQPDLT